MAVMLPRLLGAVVGLVVAVGTANAVIFFDVEESGLDVLVTSTGTLDISSLSLFNTGGRIGSTINASIGMIGTGPVGGGPSNADVYQGLTSFPTSFGSGGGINATSGSLSGILLRGDVIGSGVAGALFVPSGYLSGVTVSGSSVYANATLASLGVTPGTYEYVWASDKVVLNIVAAVPLPAAFPLFATALAGMGLLGWRRKRKASASV